MVLYALNQQFLCSFLLQTPCAFWAESFYHCTGFHHPQIYKAYITIVFLNFPSLKEFISSQGSYMKEIGVSRSLRGVFCCGAWVWVEVAAADAIW